MFALPCPPDRRHSEEASGILERGYVVTNNPLVVENLGADIPVVYRQTSFEGLLTEVRDRIHRGAVLLTHPLSGSVKPQETPYKSVILLDRKGDVDERSLELIENAIQACAKFVQRPDRFPPQADSDYQLIDWTLLDSALPSLRR